jgi:hypothetical protein
VAISKRLRYEVLRRDGFACWYCGIKSAEAKLVVDAVVPEALGGSHKDPANLRSACEPCNSGKTSSSPDAPLIAAVAEDAARWAQAMAMAAEEVLSSGAAVTEAHKRFDAAWSGWTYGDDEQPIPKDPGWKHTVDSLLAAGLPMRLLEECIQIAMSRKRVSPENTFRYMCGVAWNKVTELQKRAQEITQGTEPANAPADSADDYDRGRIDAANEVLAELIDAERDQYLEWSDDGGWGDAHGEPQTEADHITSAAATALSDVRCDLAELERRIVDVLDGLPDCTGKRAMKAARELLYEATGEDFARRLFLMDSLRFLEDELRLPAAKQYLFKLPDEQRAEWLAYASALYHGRRLGDAGWTVRAAMCAQVIAADRLYSDMCSARGEHIAACPERAVYNAQFAELKCCGPDGPEGHEGHPVCERHLEKLMDGTYISRRGRTYTIADFAEIDEDAGAPF